ncbi:unnamed protein product [Aphanomyces euteiches]|uniref:Bulb-type lectin domain-containing protein n=1 Tax=Aphanomyces euteiches TaxID=100861 RepID=A0A6G0X720_9STRA|nr:hypothetical protein Ae201684_007776 [Aphanomyces euteiches]KAH9067062.1 hypothetical protein Ae201684P_021234 [Aphanomyces euteiches]KAH9146741.1 hypothetical protein AeRB84_009387 [Aphanomyces euteiches]
MFMWTWVLLPIVTATSYCNLCDLDQDTPLKSVVDRAILSEATVKLSKIAYRESISTKSQALRFQMQSDGNLVLVDMDKLKPNWASMPKVKKVNAAYATLESDGSLAVFVNNDNDRPVWSTQSSAKASGPYCLVVSDNETRYGVSIYDSECTLLWHPPVASG